MNKIKNIYYLYIVVGVMLYGFSIFFKYTYLDDNVLILDNFFYIRDLRNIINAFQIEVFHVLHASAAYYRPILTLSFMFDAQISGKGLWFYHVTNILIHIINTCLFFVLMNKLEIKEKLAKILAFIFLIHPIMTQAVVWVPGRNDSLLAFFVLPSFIFFIDFMRDGKWRDLILHLMFWVIALFTKESAILFAGICLYYLLITKNRKVEIDKIIYLIISWFLLAAIWLFIRSNALVNPVNYTSGNVVITVLKNSPAVILYIGKVFLPFNLSVLPTLQDSTLIYGFISILGILLLFFKTKNKKYLRMLLFLGWFGVFLAPSFVRPNSVYVPDFIEHRMYVPMIGLLLFMTEIFPIKTFNFENKKIQKFIIGYLIILGILTVIHSLDYRNEIVFWENAVKNSPSHPLSHKNLGAMYYLEDRLDEAEVRYKKSLELNPYETMVHNNLGLIYARRDELDKAELEYQEELKINPYYDNAHFNYGMLYYRVGEKTKAEEMWIKTIKINPDHANALQSLARYYYEKGELDKANYFANEVRKRGYEL